MANDDLGTLTAKLSLDPTAALLGLGKFAAGVAAAFVGFESIKKVVESSVSAFGDQQVAVVLLNQALKDTGQKWTPQLQASLGKVTGAMEGLGNTGATVDSALQLLVLRGDTAQQAMGQLGELADIAAAQHTTLATAVEEVAKAASGRMSPALRELGASTLPKGVTGVKALNDILAEVKGHVAGAADALNKTLPGAMSTLHAAITDQVMVPLGAMVNVGFMAVANWITQHQALISSVLTNAMHVLGTAISDVYGFISNDLIPVLSSMWGWFNTNILPILKQVAGYLTGDFANAIKGLWQDIQNNVLPVLKPFAKAFVDVAGAAFKITEFITTAFVKILDGVAKNFGTMAPLAAGIATSFTIWKLSAEGGAIVSLLSFLTSGGLLVGLAAFGVTSALALAPWLAIAAAVAAVVEVVKAIGGLTPVGSPDARAALKVSGLSKGQGFYGAGAGSLPTGPPHALGGAVDALQTVRVGERGSELFTPRVPGYITAHDQLPSGGNVITVNLYGTNLTPDSVANAIAWKLRTA